MDTDAGDTMNKKIRNGQLEQYNFLFVVGEKEKAADTVNVRTRYCYAPLVVLCCELS